MFIMINKKYLFLLSSVLFISACSTNKVILLPNEDGSKSSIIVNQKGQPQVILSEPYSIAKESLLFNKIVEEKTSKKDVDEKYNEVFKRRPIRPIRYTLYFVSGSGTELTQESQKQIPEIKAALSCIEAGEVVIIGHTDTVGDLSGNDKLSLIRANTVKEFFTKEGVDSEVIETYGRGERELVVKTGDEVDEPRNRRVEVKIK